MTDAAEETRQPATDAEAARLRARQLRVRLCAGAAVRRAVRPHRLRQPEGARRSSASRSKQPDDSRTITIDFLADLPSVGNWEFRPTRRLDAGASRPALRDRVHRAQSHRPRDRGAGRAEHRARPGRGLFPQDRMLLLHAAEIRGRRSSGPCPCASWSILRFRARSTASRFRTLSMTSPREWAH